MTALFLLTGQGIGLIEKVYEINGLKLGKVSLKMLIFQRVADTFSKFKRIEFMRISVFEKKKWYLGLGF